MGGQGDGLPFPQPQVVGQTTMTTRHGLKNVKLRIDRHEQTETWRAFTDAACKDLR